MENTNLKSGFYLKLAALHPIYQVGPIGPIGPIGKSNVIVRLARFGKAIWLLDWEKQSSQAPRYPNSWKCVPKQLITCQKIPGTPFGPKTKAPTAGLQTSKNL